MSRVANVILPKMDFKDIYPITCNLNVHVYALIDELITRDNLLPLQTVPYNTTLQLNNGRVKKYVIKETPSDVCLQPRYFTSYQCP